MADYTNLKNQIDSNVNTNGQQKITGAVMNCTLNSMVGAMEEESSRIDKNIEDIKTVNETIATVNKNLADSITAINQNVSDGFNTINGGIDNEIRPAIEKNTEDISALQKDLGTVNTNVATSIDTINKNMADGFNTINGGINDEIRPAIEKNAEDISTLQQDLGTVNTNLVTSIEAINKNMADGFNTINGGINNEIRPAIEKNAEDITAIKEDVEKSLKIEVVDGKEVAVLPENAQLMGTLGKGIYSVASLRNYGEGVIQVEIGTTTQHLNLNTLDNVTVDTPDGKKILATTDDIVPVDLTDYALKSEIPSIEGLASVSSVTKVASDVDYIGNTLIPEMNTNTAKALEGKVDWDETKSVISIPANGSISAMRGEAQEGTVPEGGNMICQRTYDDGVSYITEVGTVKNHLTLNSTDRPTIDMSGASESLAFMTDIPEIDLTPYVKKTDADDDYQPKGDYALKSEIPSIEGLAAISAVTKVAEDVDYIGNTLIPEMNTNTANALDGKVDWDETKSVISLPANGSISAMRGAPVSGTQPEGGVLICQRTYDSGATYVTEIGTVKNHLTLNSTDKPTIDLSGASEVIAFESDLPRDINIPLRTLSDKVYTEEEILAWFGVESVPELKQFIVRGPLCYLRYGITLSYKPMYYRIPVQYMAFTEENQLQMITVGLDTRNDKVSKYTITINFDGTILEGNCNVKIDIVSLEA